MLLCPFNGKVGRFVVVHFTLFGTRTVGVVLSVFVGDTAGAIAIVADVVASVAIVL